MSDIDEPQAPSAIASTNCQDSLGAADREAGGKTSLRDLDGINPFPDIPSDFSWGGEFSSSDPLILADSPTPTPMDPDISGRDGEPHNRPRQMCQSCYYTRGHHELCPKVNRRRKAAHHYQAIVRVALRVNPNERRRRLRRKMGNPNQTSPLGRVSGHVEVSAQEKKYIANRPDRLLKTNKSTFQSEHRRKA